MSDASPTGGPPAIAWDEPGFAELTWEWDDMHMPRALTRLGRAYVQILANGMGSPALDHGLPVRWLVLVVDGYAYFTKSVDAPDDQHAAITDAETAYRRAQIASAGDWWRTAARPELERLYAEIDDEPRPGAGPDELAAAWDRAWAHASRAWQIHFLVIDGPYQALDDLVDFVKPRLDGVPEGDILGLASGAIDVLARVEAQLDDLARLAAGAQEIGARLRMAPPPALDEVRVLPDGDRFGAAVDAFLAEHGHLGHVTEDLAEPSWHVDPRSLLADVGRRMGRDEDAVAARRQRRKAAAIELEDRIRVTLAGRPAELATFERHLAAARSIGWLTEGHNYWIDRMCGDRLRRFTRRIGARLVAAGVVDDPEDICHLERDEVAQLLRRPADRRVLIAERIAEHDRWAAIIPPATIGKAPAPQEPGDADRFGGARYATTDASLLRGTGASAGVVRAIARVVHGQDDFDRVRAGDIVVARASNPGWVPLFAIAGGFVTDTGGVLSHAAVVAREFGVPAVVGTGDATARIEDGRIVEIDGTTGYVRLA